MDTNNPTPISFKAETRQLLDILIHSLYTEREIFLRELISNASDALTRTTSRCSPTARCSIRTYRLAIRILPDEEANTLTIQDTGIGMTAEELVTNLGTIAQSGARVPRSRPRERQEPLRPDRAVWRRLLFGLHGRRMDPGDLALLPERSPGCHLVLHRRRHLHSRTSRKRDARHDKWSSSSKKTPRNSSRSTACARSSASTPISCLFPIYIGDEREQANRQTAIWRQSPREVEQKDYDEFYQQLTLDFEPPLAHAHMAVDAPVQMYALLYVPHKAERSLFSLRKEDGLKLYARKVLIQEYNRDLLPEYLGFVQGVVDSEDMPLNVSRETVQSTRLMINLKKLVKSKVLDTLKKTGEEDPQKYGRFWNEFARSIKQGVAIETDEPEALYPLLRFHTTLQPEQWSSLDEYVQSMQPGQKHIYYIMGDDERSVLYSPHLDAMRRFGFSSADHERPDGRLHADPAEQIPRPAADQRRRGRPGAARSRRRSLREAVPALAEAESAALIERFKFQLGERVSDVRITDRLSDSPARLVDPQGSPNQEMQRVYRYLNRDFEVPKKVLELNPRHAILLRLNALPADDPRSELVIEQLYEDALLIEGLHPDPASMITRIQKLIEASLGSPAAESQQPKAKRRSAKKPASKSDH